MSAIKSGSNIYVYGTGNTLASITDDIADPDFIEQTGSSPDVYAVKGGAERHLRIRNGGELNVGNADYSKDEVLDFPDSTVNQTRIYVDAGGSFGNWAPRGR